MKPSIIVHGGAWDIPDALVDDHISGCGKASEYGYDLLSRGGTALDAVEAAIALMEDDPTFDAGVGSVLNQVGKVEMDAIIMDGATLRSGAVAAMRNIKNPIHVARRLLDTTQFSMLAGEGAFDFAMKCGFAECNEEDLLVGRELDDYREFLKTGVLRTRQFFSGTDTVGACAIDIEGHLACATSTGGTPRKMAGRVGDSPIIGSGAYADDTLGAASSTGWGEKIMAVVLAKTAIDMLAGNDDPRAVSERAINILKTRVEGLGGLIIISKSGKVGYFHNTPRMAFAFVEGISGSSKTGISL